MTEKILIGTVRIGEHFRHSTRYGFRSLKLYCEKQGYKLVSNEAVTSRVVASGRHLDWSKLDVIRYYLGQCKYFVWIDADTVITNPDITIESIIDKYMGDTKELLYVEARQWVNTGFMIIKNTDFMMDFFDKVWTLPNEICREQGAIDRLWRENWRGCRSLIAILPDQRVCNSDWFQWEWGQFLVHFPGCGEPGRPKNCLERMIAMFYIYKMDEETQEEYEKRLDWLKNRAGKELPLLHEDCKRTGRYLPLK